MLYVSSQIDTGLAPRMGQICQKIRLAYPAVCEVTPSYTSILIETHAFDVDLNLLGREIAEFINDCLRSEMQEVKRKALELPVYYGSEVGCDLQAVAKYAGMSVAEVVSIHSGCDYTVCAIGFAPGFAFLAELDERIAMPRRGTPRSHVPAGSVGIAERQTAVYPAATPGGWQLIGKCPVTVYDPSRSPICLFEVGDRVRFVPIDREAFVQKGGCF